jgi:spermidine/putrescine-binding protein
LKKRNNNCLLLLLLLLSGLAAADEEKVLNVYNWVDYIAPDTISNFEQEFDIQVNYDLYDSTEIVEAKLLSGKTGYAYNVDMVKARMPDAPLDSAAMLTRQKEGKHK